MCHVNLTKFQFAVLSALSCMCGVLLLMVNNKTNPLASHSGIHNISQPLYMAFQMPMVNTCTEKVIEIIPQFNISDVIHKESCLTINYSRSDPPLPPTALASSPGSGNTWVRHLIQQLTGKIANFLLLLLL